MILCNVLSNMPLARLRGIVNAYGVYQTYYETGFLSASGPDAISWIGSIQSFFLLGSAMVSGPLFDAGYFRALFSVGTFLITFGFMMTSLSSVYWQVLLAQGFCIGIGTGCLVAPSLSLLQQHFVKRRALATGIAVTGGSFGGVVYPLVFQALLPSVGFGWTNRVLGFIALATTAFPTLVMRPQSQSRKVRSLIDPKAFREPAYLCFCACMFCNNFGFFIPIFYLQTYALSHGLTNQNIALHLVAILNAASVLGRLAPAYAAAHIGPVNSMTIVGAMAGIVAFCWIAVDTAAGNVVFSVLYGFASGGVISLPAVVLASITEDLSFLGARLGTSYSINAVASLAGAPIAGAILRSTKQYLGVQLLAGFMLSAMAMFLYGVRIARVGLNPFAKV